MLKLGTMSLDSLHLTTIRYVRGRVKKYPTVLRGLNSIHSFITLQNVRKNEALLSPARTESVTKGVQAS